MHILDAVLVHNSLCNCMKRTLALVNVWFINMLCFNTFSLVFEWFSNAGLHESCCGSRIFFNTFILTEEIVMQNEYGLEQG